MRISMQGELQSARRVNGEELLNMLPELERVSETRAVFSILLDWLSIFGLIYAGMNAPLFLAPLIIIFIGGLQHGLLILMHEQVHFHLLKNQRLGEWISDIFLALPLMISTQLYRKTHYQHHSNLNSKKDPDLAFMNEREEWSIPRDSKTTFWLVVKDIFVLHFKENFINGPVALLWSPLPRLFRSREDSRGGLSLSYKFGVLAYYLLVIALISQLDLWKPFLVFWVLPLMTVLPASIRLRALPEHLGLPEGVSTQSCRTVWPLSWLEQILIAPHGISIHQEHHANPRIPFYHLDKAHRILNAHENRFECYPTYFGQSGALEGLIKRRAEKTI